MIRIRKLTDYAIVVLVALETKRSGAWLSAHEISDGIDVPLPTVAKILQLLNKADLVVATRGMCGGYKLKRTSEQISVVEIIEALEGPLAVTECANPEMDTCTEGAYCALHAHWPIINSAVRAALAKVSLADMCRTPLNLHRQLCSSSDSRI